MPKFIIIIIIIIIIVIIIIMRIELFTCWNNGITILSNTIIPLTN